MAKVRILDESRSILDKVAINGVKITIGDTVIDCSEYQEDTEKRIDIFMNQDGMISIGSGDLYVANIVIPPKQYTEYPTGEVDEGGNPIVQKEEIPLDSAKIILTLWPVKD
jgi:hypothetical protein